MYAIASVETTDVTCNGTATGTATVNVEGGIAPYTYLWSDGQTTQTATNLAAGTYSVEVKDGLSNTVNADVEIYEAAALQLVMGEDQLVYAGYGTSCATVGATSVSGGRGSYTYAWSTGETSATISVCPTATTTYSVEVMDASGCSVSGAGNSNCSGCFLWKRKRTG